MATPARNRALPALPAIAVLGPLAGLLGSFAALFLLLTVLFGAPGQEPGASSGPLRYGVSAFALSDIPRDYLDLYQDTAEQSGLDWSILAAIGSIETNHGRSTLPGVQSGINFATAAAAARCSSTSPRPPGHWDRSGVDGNHDGSKDVYDPEDAIPAAAGYLKAGGAPDDYRRAIFSYNHADWYVDDVLAQAEHYRGKLLNSGRVGDVDTVPGGHATLGADGLARAPENAPDAVKRMIAAGNKISDRPYLYGGGHPAFLTGWGLDCSSSTSYLLHAGGLLGTSALISGGFETYGDPGPGKWVTIYANADHVFMRVAGLRNDTSDYNTPGSPTAGQDGPRWRLGPRYEAGFVVRHPRGL